MHCRLSSACAIANFVLLLFSQLIGMADFTTASHGLATAGVHPPCQLPHHAVPQRHCVHPPFLQLHTQQRGGTPSVPQIQPNAKGKGDSVNSCRMYAHAHAATCSNNMLLMATCVHCFSQEFNAAEARRPKTDWIAVDKTVLHKRYALAKNFLRASTGTN